jgi:hypothetical protein
MFPDRFYEPLDNSLNLNHNSSGSCLERWIKSFFEQGGGLWKRRLSSMAHG